VLREKERDRQKKINIIQASWRTDYRIKVEIKKRKIVLTSFLSFLQFLHMQQPSPHSSNTSNALVAVKKKTLHGLIQIQDQLIKKQLQVLITVMIIKK